MAIHSMIVKYLLITTSMFFSLSIAADISDNADSEFSIPKGNYQSGKQAFIDLQCTACHSISGIDLPAAEEMFEVSVELSKSTFRKSEAALVTALINPSHSLIKGLPIESIYADGNSKMPVFNDVMTVTQLIDLVTFLQKNNQVLH